MGAPTPLMCRRPSTRSEAMATSSAVPNKGATCFISAVLPDPDAPMNSTIISGRPNRARCLQMAFGPPGADDSALSRGCPSCREP